MSRLLLSGLLLVAAGSAQDGAFYPGANLTPASWPPVFLQSSVAPTPPALLLDATQFTATPDPSVRDLDGDGVLDLTSLFDGVTVWRGLGGGRFAEAEFLPTSVSATSDVTGQWGDMDGDGRLDAVFLVQNQIEVLLDQGDGTFLTTGLQVLPSADYNAHSWVLGDVDGDDVPDIVGRNGHGFPGTRLDFLGGQPGGTFDPPVVVEVTPGFVDTVALADLDGDGLTDLVVDWWLSAPNHLRTYLQQPGGGWLPLDGFQLTTSFGATRVEARDMTGDGHADVIVHERPNGLNAADTVTIYIGRGDGTVSSTPHELPGVGKHALFVDVDGDVLVDVVSTAQAGERGAVSVVTRPDGTLAPPVLTRHRAMPAGTADLDGDGVLDLFTVDVVLYGRGDGSFEASRGFDLGVTPNKQRNVALADFDGDGVLDVAALDAVLAAMCVAVSDVAARWETVHATPTKYSQAVAAGDLDLDGHLDVIVQQVNDSAQEYWLGRGDGTFDPGVTFPQSFLGILGNTGLGVGQFNGTAWPDLVATGNGMLRRKLGQGEFVWGQLKQTPLPPGNSSPWLVVSDLDQDGLDDVLVVQPEVYVYRCIGHGDFEPAVLVDGGATHLRLVDVDGDGLQDLVTSDGTEVRVRLADGAAGFGAIPAAVVTSDLEVAGTDLADVDGDGLLDLALGHDESWSLHLGLPGGGFAPEPVDRFDVAGTGQVLRFVDRNDDGRPDLLVVADDLHHFGLQLFTHRDGPWDDEGFALAGAAGSPFLWGTGPLVGGSTLGLELADAAPGAPFHLVVGVAQLSLPFKGGVLVPAPSLVVSGFGLDGEGQATVASPWPAGTPPGVSFWMQAWIEDGSGPAGLTASNGLRATTP